MLETILFVAWSLLIPIVPLIGVSHYRAKKDSMRTFACWALFGVQLFLSAAYITEYLK